MWFHSVLEPHCSLGRDSLSSLLKLFKEGVSGNGSLDSLHPFLLLTLVGRLDSVVEMVANDDLTVCVGLARLDHRTALDLLIQTNLKAVLQRREREGGREGDKASLQR